MAGLFPCGGGGRGRCSFDFGVLERIDAELVAGVTQTGVLTLRPRLAAQGTVWWVEACPDPGEAREVIRMLAPGPAGPGVRRGGPLGRMGSKHVGQAGGGSTASSSVLLSRTVMAGGEGRA